MLLQISPHYFLTKPFHWNLYNIKKRKESISNQLGEFSQGQYRHVTITQESWGGWGYKASRKPMPSMETVPRPAMTLIHCASIYFDHVWVGVLFSPTTAKGIHSVDFTFWPCHCFNCWDFKYQACSKQECMSHLEQDALEEERTGTCSSTLHRIQGR